MVDVTGNEAIIKHYMDRRNVGKITMPVLRMMVEEAGWDDVYKAGRKEWESLTSEPYRYGVVVARKGNINKLFPNNKEAANFFAGTLNFFMKFKMETSK